MKTQKLFIAAFLIFLASCTFIAGQIPELKKFEFMKGEFRNRGGDKDILKGEFSGDGKEFNWVEKQTNNEEYGFINYDEASKSFRLKEVIYRRSAPIYYKGKETSEGFYFYELTAVDGGVKKDGEEVSIRRLEPGIFNIEHFYNYYGKKKPKQWIPSEYYSTNLSLEQLDKHIRIEIGKLDYLVGKFVAGDGNNRFVGKFTDDGKKYVWNFASPEKTSRAVFSYDFHWNKFTMKEKIKQTNGKTTTIVYSGRMNWNEVKLSVYARIDKIMTRIDFIPLRKDKVLMQVMKYDESPVEKIIYTKVQ